MNNAEFVEEYES